MIKGMKNPTVPENAGDKANVIASVSSDIAERIGWNNPANQRLIRACFYLGYGYSHIQELVGNTIRANEAGTLIDTAEVLGMTDNDVVIVYEHETDRNVQHNRRTAGEGDNSPR